MEALLAFLAALLRVLLPALLDYWERRRGPVEARPQGALDDRLIDKIRSKWGAAAIALLLCLAIGGCATRTVYIAEGQPVRLAETLRGVKVWVMTDTGPTLSRVDLLEGWYCLSDPREATAEAAASP